MPCPTSSCTPINTQHAAITPLTTPKKVTDVNSDIFKLGSKYDKIVTLSQPQEIIPVTEHNSTVQYNIQQQNEPLLIIDKSVNYLDNRDIIKPIATLPT